jgi:hypothetical protein
MRQMLLGEDDAAVRRRQFLRTAGLAGAAAVGLGALYPTDAAALTFTVKELEEGLRSIGTEGNIAIGTAFTHNTLGKYNLGVGSGALGAIEGGALSTEGWYNTAVGAYALAKAKKGVFE